MQEKNIGSVVQIIGPVLDIRFPAGHLPDLLNAIEIERDGGKLVCEVAQQLGDDVVRCIAMSSTDGMVRGMEAVDTGSPIKVPVGNETLGRVFNLLGRAIDNKPQPVTCEKWSIHRDPPAYDEQQTSTEILETGIKVVDLIAPYAKGGKIGLFGGAGVARRSSSWSSSTTLPSSTAASPSSRVSANAPVRAMISITRCSSPALSTRPPSSTVR